MKTSTEIALSVGAGAVVALFLSMQLSQIRADLAVDMKERGCEYTGKLGNKDTYKCPNGDRIYQ